MVFLKLKLLKRQYIVQQLKEQVPSWCNEKVKISMHQNLYIYEARSSYGSKRYISTVRNKRPVDHPVPGSPLSSCLLHFASIWTYCAKEWKPSKDRRSSKVRFNGRLTEIHFISTSASGKKLTSRLLCTFFFFAWKNQHRTACLEHPFATFSTVQQFHPVGDDGGGPEQIVLIDWLVEASSIKA